MVTAERLINRQMPVLHPEDDPVDALNLMDQFRVADLPVVDGGTFRGMISETALMSVDSVVSAAMPVSAGLLSAAAKPSDHILDVLRIATENHLSVVPVVNAEGIYLGCITLEDLVAMVSRMQGAANPGGIIVLEMEEKDYSLQQIARIVEENDAKILSVTVSDGDQGKIEVNLKVSEPDLNAILQSLHRFSYSVKASYQEEEYNESLRKRYEELMRFLNI